MKKIHILIADDHRIFREGLAELLAKEPNMEIVADVGDGNAIREVINSRQVDIILMDIDMGETSGIAMTKEIKTTHPDIKILTLSMHGDKSYIIKMLEAGANGYILKNAGKEEMINAIHTAANGHTYLSSQVSARLLEHIANPTPASRKKNEDTPLTDREIEVLILIAEEYSNPEIAEKLFISVRTVDTHRRNLLDKLGVKNTAGLVKYAIQHGFLDN